MRPRAVLPQDPLPTEVAGMKISVPRFSPRRLFSSFPPSLPPGAPSFRPCDVRQEVFQVSPRFVSPGFSRFKRPPRDFIPRKTPSEIYARVQPCPRNGAQLLATVTDGISEGWFTIIAGTSRYRPLQCRGGYGARGKCGNIQQLPGIKECVNCEILAARRRRRLFVARNGNVTSSAFAYSHVAQLLPPRLTFFRISFLFFFFYFLAYRALLKLLIYFSSDFRRPGDAPRK